MIKTLTIDALRLLTFRKPSTGIAERWTAYLAFGLFFTWLAGMGRYWDNPRAELWQHLGLGSIAYVFCLSALLWIVILPMGPKLWSDRNVLVFVTLTSPPAVLYAIPVEQFLPLETAQSANAWFLGIVAMWRVALLAWFLRVFAGLSGPAAFVGTLLPLVAIVVALTALNLEHVVFEIMAGVDPEDETGNDRAYIIVTMLAVLSSLLAPFLLAAYAWIVYHARRIA